MECLWVLKAKYNIWPAIPWRHPSYHPSHAPQWKQELSSGCLRNFFYNNDLNLAIAEVFRCHTPMHINKIKPFTAARHWALWIPWIQSKHQRFHTHNLRLITLKNSQISPIILKTPNSSMSSDCDFDLTSNVIMLLERKRIREYKKTKWQH